MKRDLELTEALRQAIMYSYSGKLATTTESAFLRNVLRCVRDFPTAKATKEIYAIIKEQKQCSEKMQRR